MSEGGGDGVSASGGLTAREGHAPERVSGGTAREGVFVGGSGFVGSVLLPCLSDRFAVLDDLGSGGEANVLLVADVRAGERWVVKQYRRKGWSPSPEVLERLTDAKAEHSVVSWGQDRSARGVVWLQEWGVDPATGLFFEVMEYVEGGSLAGRGSRWPAADLARALMQAVSAFHLLVGAHRDIKPANVLVRSAEGPVLVLVDLGLARDVSEDSSRLSKREGSAAYQAPEASQGLVSRAGDWWAVGMILAEEALGFHPYARGDGSLLPDQVIQAELAQRDVPNLDAIADDRVRLLCRGLLTRDADRRWGKAQVLAWLRGDSPPVTASSILSVEDSIQRPQRVRTVLFAGVEYDSPQGLAAAFAADPDAAAQVLFLNRDVTTLKDLELMLGAHGLHDAQGLGLLDGYRSGEWQTTFLRLLTEMDPNLAPELAGQSMTPEAVAELARQIIESDSGKAAERQSQALEWVTDHDLWRLWRGLPGMSGSAAVAERVVRFLPPVGGNLQFGFHLVPDWIDGIDPQKVVLLDQDTVANYWDRQQTLGQAWILLWAIRPEDASRRIEESLFVLSEGSEIPDQKWWFQLTKAKLDISDAATMATAVGALLSYPLAKTAQQEFEPHLTRIRKRAQRDADARAKRERKVAQREAQSHAQQERRRRIIDEKAEEKADIEEELTQLRSRIFPWNARRVRELQARLARLYPWDDPAFAWSRDSGDWVRR